MKAMRAHFTIIPLLSAALLAACSEPQQANPASDAANQSRQPSDAAPAAASPEILLQSKDVVITTSDFQQLLEAQVPEEHRAAILSDEKRVRQLIGNLFIIRQLAHEARQMGLDKAEQWKMEYQADRVLMTARLKAHLDSLKQPDFLALAQESYKANPEKYQQPESISVSHILVSTDQRSEDEAKQRAEMILAELEAGNKSFEELALEYSDDPSAKQNQGNLGFFSRGRMVKPFEDAAFALEKPGALSPLVKTSFGYHIIRLNERKPAHMIPFEEVKDRLIAEERANFIKKAQTEFLESVRTMDGIIVNQEAVSALVIRNPMANPPAATSDTGSEVNTDKADQ